MSTTTLAPTTPTPSTRPVRERFAPLLQRIAEGAVAREQDHELPRAAVRELLDAGFGRLRLPVAEGGEGLDLVELAELLVDLATADSNLPQVFRGHVAWVEQVLSLPPGEHRDRWVERIVAGELVGNSWSEVGDGVTGEQQTVVTTREGRTSVTGRKYYTTGTIFADWTDATARRLLPDGSFEVVTVLVPVRAPGVEVSDDWDGFGQQLTGTGTLVLDDVEVDPADVAPFTDRFRYQTALYQLVLLAVHAGIAAAVERDTAQQVRARTRTYTHGLAPLVRHDAQVLSVAGEISATAFTARALVRAAAQAVQAAADTAGEPGTDRDRAANVEAEIRTAQAQVVLSEAVPRAATLLFNTLGASGTSRARDLDRHWRNARTVASHNPVIYKQRIVGDWSVNGTEPPFVWDIGTHASVARGAQAEGATR
ncbi:acyl-CoA dehydrogenase family protein [Kineococcus aurantiacus]|uniref:Alkylation response protein AidB-like acyl-CoA dehydrogenase n=1 Tax=Kineococcus aurantiacus TaxID=37633 RepID=A0A7Y9J299_9ACTN|nr:acyl-CoA dehydrogenase family protein [Kineococcus aurantiacus]NYD23991.1 alkylation response protein AidB-like acyl-CoA dehydrogenase [Kineococcus aurantiacus]